MCCRILSFTVLVLTASFFFLSGGSIAQQAGGPCGDTVCGPGYKAQLQLNGSCICIAADCENLDGCPEPPKAVEDCPSIEGCDPPRIIKP